jgi:hypothetical protein
LRHLQVMVGASRTVGRPIGAHVVNITVDLDAQIIRFINTPSKKTQRTAIYRGFNGSEPSNDTRPRSVSSRSPD